MDKIKEALLKLNPSDNSHWTSDGLPRLEIVRAVTGDSAITRQNITSVAPNFTKDNPFLEDDGADTDDGANTDKVAEDSEIYQTSEGNISTDIGTSEVGSKNTAEVVTNAISYVGKQLEEAQLQFNRAQKVLTNLQIEQDRLTVALEEMTKTQKTTTNQIQAYLKSQIAVRKQKVEQQRAMAKAMEEFSKQ